MKKSVRMNKKSFLMLAQFLILSVLLFSCSTVFASGTVTITAETPTNGEVDVPLDTQIILAFSANVDWSDGPGVEVLKNLTTGKNVDLSGTTESLKLKNKAIITLPPNLDNNCEYSFIVPGGYYVDEEGNPSEAFTLNFTTVKAEAVTVISTSPSSGQKDVPVNTEITVDFSKKINVALSDSMDVLGGGYITICDLAGKEISGMSFSPPELSSNGRRIVIEPNEGALNYNTTYIVTIKANTFIDDLKTGNEKYNFGFTTIADDTIAPVVVNTNPSNGKTITELDKYYGSNEIKVYFSEPITLVNDNTVGSISVTDNSGADAGFYAEFSNYESSGMLQILSRSTNQTLSPGKYNVTIKDGYFRDKAGNTNPEYKFSFTILELDTTPPTVVSTNPTKGATITALSKYNNRYQILVNFSEDVTNVGDDTDGAISVTDENGNDAGFYAEYGTYGNDKRIQILTNKQNQTVKPGKYTVKINKGYFKDDAGNKNTAYSFSFTKTDDTIAPYILSTDPTDDENDVNPKISQIVINMSRSFTKTGMDCVTIKDSTGKKISHLDYWNSGVITLKPNPNSAGWLEYGKTYTVSTIAGTLKASNGLYNKAESFKFRTVENVDTKAPEVTSSKPGDCFKDIDVTTTIEIGFSEWVTCKNDQYYLGIKVVDENGNKVPLNEVTYANSDGYTKNTAKFVIKPKSNLLPNTKYTVYVGKDYVITDKAGNKLVPWNYYFTTKAEASTISPVAKTFLDMPSNHWAYQAVEEMVKLGVLNGYSDGSFRPNDNVTREEFAKMMVLALNVPIVTPGSATFKDIRKNRWSYKYVESAKSYLTGYQKTDGFYFKGTKNAVREDMAYALVKAKSLQDQAVNISELNRLFKDVNKITPDLKKYVLIAYKNEIIKGNADGTFNPKGGLTRAEAAKLLYNVIANDDDDSGKVILKQ